MFPKKIYLTYKKEPPKKVFKHWKKLNPNYEIEFSTDKDCIQFLKKYFGKELMKMFKKIPEGMYKADLWRLCKLYINGGVYADIDLVPYISIDELIKDQHHFYSCLALDRISIFQAFIVTFPKNPLLLSFIASFIQNKPFQNGFVNGPCLDMYNCLKSSIHQFKKIKGEKVYTINEIYFPILVGFSNKNIKRIKLDILNYKFAKKYNLNFNNLKVRPHSFNDTFAYKIKGDILEIKRTDKKKGWNHFLIFHAYIGSFQQKIYLFQEYLTDSDICNAYVEFKNKKIFDSRDLEYYKLKSENKIWK